MGFFSKLFGAQKRTNYQSSTSTSVCIDISLSSVPDKMGKQYTICFTDGSKVKWKPLYDHEVEGLLLTNKVLKRSEDQFIISYMQKCIQSWSGVLDMHGKSIPCTWLMISKLYNLDKSWFIKIYDFITSKTKNIPFVDDPFLMTSPRNNYENRNKIQYRATLSSLFDIESIDIKYREEIRALVKKCDEIEEKYKETCYLDPSPGLKDTFYYKLTVLAKKAKQYSLEYAVAQRYKDIIEEHKKMCKDDGVKTGGMCSVGEKIYARLGKAKEMSMQGQSTAKERPTSPKSPSKRAPKGPSLDEQCADIGIDILEITIPCEGRKYTLPDANTTTTKVEEAVLAYLENDGYDGGTFYELHPVMQVIQGCCLEYLKQKSSILYMEDYRARTFSVQVEMYKLEENRVLELVSCKSATQLLTAWENVYYMSEQLKAWFPRIDRNGMKAVLQAMSGNTIEDITRHIFKAPDVASVGWPDIFVVKDGKIKLFEVKTKDKLLDTQLYTIPNLAKSMGFDVSVIRVTKQK